MKALALAEVRLLLRSPIVWGALVLALALGVTLGWTRLPDWERFAMNAGTASLLLGAGLLLAGHLAVSRDHRAGVVESHAVLPTPLRRRTVSLLALAPVAALAGVLLLGALLLSLLPDWPAGRLDWPNLLVVVVVPVLAVSVGVAIGRWLPATAAGPLGLIVSAALVLALPGLGNGDSYLGLWLSPVLMDRNWAPGAPQPTGWHLLYLVALVVFVGAVPLLRHWRILPALVGVLALTLAASTVGPQLSATPRAISAEMEEPYTGEAALVCQRHNEVRYCALPGYERWIVRWREAVAPVVVVLPPSVRADLPRVRQFAYSFYESQSPADVATDLIWGRQGRWAADSRAQLATSFAATIVGLPGLWTADPAIRLRGCSASGQARTVITLWLAAQALPDGAALLRAHRLGLFPSRYGQPEIDAALALLNLPRQQVAGIVAAGWDRLTAPTAGFDVLTALGLPVAANVSPGTTSASPDADGTANASPSTASASPDAEKIRCP
ncbi:hypothetical protein GCM10027280_16530 [Micromonospora polyrhachis]|uniref:Uncharacterized protein n=1 Tax=Micromonospora polyrhachis TaxID=1282883 RepID=A0A7W7WP98_9ACTN|nr:hypothetical protein [Micromonospora polyrhachis]MBB4958459.1 hypothetical protein [Micromonospora polyrhachis]